MTAFRTRIVRVRPKRGQKVELLYVPLAEDHKPQLIRDDVERLLSEHRWSRPIAGYAIVMWDEEMLSNGEMRVWNNPIPSMLVPDFVRNWLLAHRTEEWTIETLKNRKLV